MTVRLRCCVGAFAALAQRLVVAAFVVTLAVLAAVGPHLPNDGPGDRNGFACLGAQRCALPDLPDRARHHHSPQLAVQRTGLQVRRDGAATAPIAVAGPAQLSWVSPVRWRNVGRGAAPAMQPPALTRSGRGPPVA
jgi:hypothetical protein